jgi:hypothetical protein
MMSTYNEVVKLIKTPETKDGTSLEDWIADGDIDEMTAAEIAAEWDELPAMEVDTDWYDVPMTPAEMGRKGGRSTSAAKQAAARANGRKGGRPRKE